MDEARIRQVLNNLLANAIKYNSRGGHVTLRVKHTPQEIQLQIEDTGRGIRKEFLPHIFDPFSQQDVESTRSHGGLGLGLAIARQLVELHGGTIRAFSAGEGKGSRFIVKLPFARLQQAVISSEAESSAEANLPKGYRVLVVEDDRQTQLAIVKLLESSGAVVRALSHGAELLQTIQDFQPALLISDIGLPGEDGFSLMRRVRKHEDEQGLPTLPAIALTAFAREDDQNKALAAGFQQHVAKPVDASTLLRLISSYVTKVG
jgi:CheY-like chemotaxis protein